MKWPAYAQYLDEAGVDWRSYQNSYNWATNSGLFYFEAFQKAAVNSSLYQRGLAFDGDNGLAAFKAAAANGTLPEVSWVFPPGAMQEHSPNTPNDGAWYMNELVNAVIHGKNYEDTVMLINYDGMCNESGIFDSCKRSDIALEAGGWGDAVKPLVSPRGTAGEWFEDPDGELGYTFSGPGIFLYWNLVLLPFQLTYCDRNSHSSYYDIALYAWRKGLHRTW